MHSKLRKSDCEMYPSGHCMKPDHDGNDAIVIESEITRTRQHHHQHPTRLRRRQQQRERRRPLRVSTCSGRLQYMTYLVVVLSICYASLMPTISSNRNKHNKNRSGRRNRRDSKIKVKTEAKQLRTKRPNNRGRTGTLKVSKYVQSIATLLATIAK